MLALGERASDWRNARLDAGDASPGAGDILLFAKPGITTYLGQPQRLSLVHQAPLSDRELLLQATQLEVVARHFRRNADPHIVDISFEAVGGCRGCTCERMRPKTSISQNASKPRLYDVTRTGSLDRPALAGPGGQRPRPQ